MEINTKCQVFTPADSVINLLDWVGYKNNLRGLKVLENSCGDGSILAGIVNRYICDSIQNGISLDLIRAGLQEDIHGIEIDISHIVTCKKNLNSIAKKFGITGVKWNIYHGDFLKKKTDDVFDYIIGNPPYITYKELDEDERKFLKENYSTCKEGKFDYCYAFIEASIKVLSSSGRMAYLIPSNIFKNEFGFLLRELLKNNITDVYDFTNQKLFEKKLTCSSIIIYDASFYTEKLMYHDVAADRLITIPKDLLEHKWRFIKRSKTNHNENKIVFGELFHAASSVATLCNKVFIINDFVDVGSYILVGKHKIEKSLLREAASPRSKNTKNNEWIIFPYYYGDNCLMHYSEDEFLQLFPYGAKYLNCYIENLKKRDSDSGINWFEYGRSQALKNLNQSKLLISTLITKMVKTYLLPADTVPTSGLYITSIADYGLDVAEKILNDDAFLSYVKSIGVISNGNSYRISPKDINQYVFPKSFLL